MSQYTRKPEVVHVEAITEPLFEQLRDAEPGVVKHASVGDYFAVGADGSKRIITPGQLRREYEPVIEGPTAIDVLRGDLDALRSRVTALEMASDTEKARDAKAEEMAKAAQHQKLEAAKVQLQAQQKGGAK